jgi:hypothetical protein
MKKPNRLPGMTGESEMTDRKTLKVISLSPFQTNRELMANP